jgi:hypothetical protein
MNLPVRLSIFVRPASGEWINVRLRIMIQLPGGFVTPPRTGGPVPTSIGTG